MSNRIVVAGTVGKEPEVKQVGQTGTNLFEFTIADRVWVGKEHTNWLKAVVVIGSRDPGNYPFRDVRVGSSVTISGELVLSEWTDKTGAKRISPEIRGAEIMHVAAKAGSEPGRNQAPPAAKSQRSAPANDDDGIPF